jgi:fumarylacetoacetase
LSAGGKQPLAIGTGENRCFLEDGDRVTFRGWCEKPGATRIGFGEVTGCITPAR